MKQFRYIINGVAMAWRNLKDVSTEKAEAIARRFNKWGFDWFIEYK